MPNNPKEANRWSILITGLIQVIMVVFLYFITAWQAPNPPIPTYGIELEMTFTGESTPTNAIDPPVENAVIEETSIEKPLENDNSEDHLEDANESTDAPKADVLEENIPETDLDVNEITDEVVEDALADTELSEGSDAATEPQSNDSNTPQENALNESNEVIENIDSANTENPDESITEIDERALFSNRQGSNDESKSYELNISGFRLAEAPIIDDPSDEEGSVTIKILVGDDGYAIPVEIVSATVSPAVANIYRNAVSQLYFERTSNQVPPQTSGTIKFIIKSN